MTVTDPYTGIGVITRGAFDSDMAAISLSLHSSCNDIALNEKNSPSFCQIHFYRGIFHLLSSCTLSTLRAFNSSSFHPSSPQIHPFSMIPVTPQGVSIHALLTECDSSGNCCSGRASAFQSTHSLRSATAPDLIHCYSTEQIILCANLPKKTVIARLLFLSIYLSIFYSQCITPIADLLGNSCELEVGAQAMFNSL